VVDIEVHPKIQSRENLAKGILRWLKEVESVYGVKPIIYTGFAFYRDYLSSYPEIRKYPLWVSAFSSDRRGDPIIKSAILHQFSSQLRVPGIPENVVDGNDFDVRNERLVFLR
jgi:lysozyme